MGKRDFAADVKESVNTYVRTAFDETVWKQLSEDIRFVQGEFQAAGVNRHRVVI